MGRALGIGVDRRVNGVSASATVALLKELEFTDVVIIPDDGSRLLHEAFVDDDAIGVYMPTREGEGIAVAAGLWVGGRRPIVVLQNTGLMEGGDTLRGCGIGPSIPLVLLVGWRGYPGAMAGTVPMDSAFPYTEPLLDAWQIPYRHLMSDDDLHVVSEMADLAVASSRPTAVLSGYPFRP